MSPRTIEENQRIRDEQREKILDAAIKVFARKGVAATKMADIAAGAGVSYGLAYHYFSNKEQLFVALVKHAVSGLTEVAQQALTIPGTALDKLRWLLQKILEGALEQPEFLLLVRQALDNATISDELREHVLAEGAQFIAVMRLLIVEGQTSGLVMAADPDQLVTLLHATIHGLTINVSFSVDLPFNQVAPHVDLLLRMLQP